MAYQLRDDSGSVVMEFQDKPQVLIMPNGDHVHCADVGWSNGTHTLVEVVSGKDVQIEADRRLSAGFQFGGHKYQSDPASRQAIIEAAMDAQLAVDEGAEGGNYAWPSNGVQFSWRSYANEDIPMDAPTVLLFHRTAREHRDRIRKAAARLKDQFPIPADYKSDKHWL